MAECPRVLAGKATTARGGSSVDGLWVSRAGQNVYSCGDGDLLFDSRAPSFGQILLLQEISYSASGTTTQDYLNQGGVKTYFFWWYTDDMYGGGSTDRYTLMRPTSGTGSSLVVKNEKINSTTNRLSVTDATGVAGKVVVMVLKESGQ